MRRPPRRPESLASEARFRAALAAVNATLLESEWLGALMPHRVRCEDGHEVSPTPHNLFRGQNVCGKCTRDAISVGAELAFRRAAAVLGLEPLEDRWRGVKHLYKLRCGRGHVTYRRPDNVRRSAETGGRSCRWCDLTETRAGRSR